MKTRKRLNQIRERRKKRVRSLIRGTASKPRLSVFRSNRYVYAQLIDDSTGKTIVSASSQEVKKGDNKTGTAKKVGELLAQRAKKSGVSSAVFDRGSYNYHGRVRALAESAREAGMKI